MHVCFKLIYYLTALTKFSISISGIFEPNYMFVPEELQK